VRYGAFLSYSHADERLARWLLQRLEGYRVPKRLVGTPGRHGPVPARLGPVFRDRDELHAAGDLGSTITAALADSAALVVICSPAAARSRWVNAEAQAFRASGRGDRIFCFVVDGDPTGRDAEGACFPPALLAPDVEGGPPREPLAADSRTEGDGRDRAFLRLVAGLLGVGYDDLARRETQRRQRRLVAIAATSLVVTTVALGLAAAAWARAPLTPVGLAPCWPAILAADFITRCTSASVWSEGGRISGRSPRLSRRASGVVSISSAMRWAATNPRWVGSLTMNRCCTSRVVRRERCSIPASLSMTT
jgi:hypothetical protein